MYTDDDNNSDSNVETVLAVMNGYIHYYLSSVHNCEDHFHIPFFNRSAHI